MLFLVVVVHLLITVHWRLKETKAVMVVFMHVEQLLCQHQIAVVVVFITILAINGCYIMVVGPMLTFIEEVR